MANVVVYTKMSCPYCDRAKQLLSAKQVAFEEIRIDSDPQQRDRMVELSGRRTVPQIFIDGQSIGGFDDLADLDKDGRLDALLY